MSRLDDTPVYNAIKPNVSNIGRADFVLESTPNGKRGFFWSLFMDKDNEFSKLEQPYTVSMGKLLDEATIEAEKKNPHKNFAASLLHHYQVYLKKEKLYQTLRYL
jgi:hypothetical protein